jgi:[acyl-carrier-protein] S-malonyltransferase
MKPAADRLSGLLDGISFRPPRFPVMSNVTGRPHGTPDQIRAAMVLQVTHSVRWIDCVACLRRSGVGRMVECGPGRVLSGLVKRIDRDAELHNIGDLTSLQTASEKL